jgi:hypothetical protein
MKIRCFVSSLIGGNVWRPYEMSEDTQNRPSLPGELTREFLKEEQKQRRQELENLIARIESDQRNGLLFTGPIWGWLTTNVQNLNGLTGKSAIAIFILPTVIMGFFFCRWYAIENTILRIAEYTQNLEKLFKLPDNRG